MDASAWRWSSSGPEAGRPALASSRSPGWAWSRSTRSSVRRSPLASRVSRLGASAAPWSALVVSASWARLRAVVPPGALQQRSPGRSIDSSVPGQPPAARLVSVAAAAARDVDDVVGLLVPLHQGVDVEAVRQVRQFRPVADTQLGLRRDPRAQLWEPDCALLLVGADRLEVDGAAAVVDRGGPRSSPPLAWGAFPPRTGFQSGLRHRQLQADQRRREAARDLAQGAGRAGPAAGQAGCQRPPEAAAPVEPPRRLHLDGGVRGVRLHHLRPGQRRPRRKPVGVRDRGRVQKKSILRPGLSLLQRPGAPPLLPEAKPKKR